MEIRKIQYQGGSTYTVSLPKKWIRKLEVKKGDKIVFKDTENLLIIYPFKNKNKEKEKQIDADKDILSRGILASYLAGFKNIRIIAHKSISKERKKEIEKIVSKLNGLQIVEESANGMLLQDLLNTDELDLKKAVKRAYSLCASMHRDAILALKRNDKELAREVIQRDDAVDCLYFLSVRQLRSALNDPRYAINGVECLDYRMLVKCIEEIADSCCVIANKVLEIDKKHDLEEFSEACHAIHEQAFAAYLSKNITNAQALRKKEKGILEMKKRLLKPELSPILDELVSIAKNGVDISDLVI